MLRKKGFLLLLPLLSLVALPAGLPDAPELPALDSIKASNLRSTVYFLASDHMRGRESVSVHNEIVTDYLAHRFEMMGLEPGGEDGTFFQSFRLTRGVLRDGNRLEIKDTARSNRTAGVVKEDFFPALLSAEGRGEGEVVFAGYGITAPELGWDDYADMSVRGRIALILSHDPRSDDPMSPFEGLVGSEYGRERHKVLNAQRRGAVGVVIVTGETGDAAVSRFPWLAGGTWPGDTARAPHTLEIWADKVTIPAVYASPAMAERLFDGAPSSLSEIRREIDRRLHPVGFPLEGKEALIEVSVERHSEEVRNVLAALPGTDPHLRDEWIILGAHFDHVGAEGSVVFNGADDNATGTAGLLEIASALAASPTRPRRSILFAGWNAEEKGLLGSFYYVHRPSVDLEGIRAKLQMDMIGRSEEVPDPENPRFRGMEPQSAEENLNSVNVLGYSRSEDLRRLVERANRRVGMEVRFRYDNHPTTLLRRSDNWPFLVSGIPALFFTTGLHPDYHLPSDTADKIDYEKLEKVVRLVLLSLWKTANATDSPRFVPWSETVEGLGS